MTDSEGFRLQRLGDQRIARLSPMFFSSNNKSKSYHRRNSWLPSGTGDRDDADRSPTCQSNISVDPYFEGAMEGAALIGV